MTTDIQDKGKKENQERKRTVTVYKRSQLTGAQLESGRYVVPQGSLNKELGLSSKKMQEVASEPGRLGRNINARLESKFPNEITAQEIYDKNYQDLKARIESALQFLKTQLEDLENEILIMGIRDNTDRFLEFELSQKLSKMDELLNTLPKSVVDADTASKAVDGIQKTSILLQNFVSNINKAMDVRFNQHRDETPELEKIAKEEYYPKTEKIISTIKTVLNAINQWFNNLGKSKVLEHQIQESIQPENREKISTNTVTKAAEKFLNRDIGKLWGKDNTAKKDQEQKESSSPSMHEK